MRCSAPDASAAGHTVTSKQSDRGSPAEPSNGRARVTADPCTVVDSGYSERRPLLTAFVGGSSEQSLSTNAVRRGLRSEEPIYY